ncbi:MAG: polysaccharide deacetylase family protein, partial [Prevotella sp.]|nr:polysaccharide deacetylase family protein [Prevotella sp.]
MTYTFDDGLQDQYTLAFPELRKRGLKATFAVIGSKVGGIVRSSQDKAMGITGTPTMTWDMLREMAADGQEISSHGWEHKNVTKLSADQLRFEVQHNDTMIYMQTGHFPRTYFFPGNRRDSVALTFCQQERVGCRTAQIAIGSKHDSTWLNHWVDGLIARGEWGVGMTHGIATGYDHFSDPKVLWSHWDYITAHQDRVWVATFHDVAAYMAERDNAILSISTHPGVLIVNVTCTLSSSLYNVPLTLVINQEAGVCSVRQGNHNLPIYCRNGKTLVDIDPHGGAIEIGVGYGQRQTPVMGWSSWNTYRVNISDSLIMRQADAMVQKGLKDAGYTYINVDDGFFGYRD